MTNMITSSHNPRLARIRGLLEKRAQREEEQAYVVEGVRLMEEAQAAGIKPELVLFSERLSARGKDVLRGFESTRAEVLEVPHRLMEGLTGTEASQGLLAVLPMPHPALPALLDFVLIADNLRDPGNLGTLLRSAAAAGVQAALLSPGTTDAFAPKVLRAGMGAHFRLPVLHLSWAEIRAACKDRPSGATAPAATAHGTPVPPPGATAPPPLHIFLAEAAEGDACWDLDLRQPLALIVGSEAEGATSEALALTDQPITIPMPGKSESLNAAAAASILLFEVVRQRSSTRRHKLLYG